MDGKELPGFYCRKSKCMLVNLLYESALIAVVAVVFSYILIDDDMIFGFYGKLIRKLPEKVAFVLGDCPYCFGGQIALWWYVFGVDWYNPVEHIYFTSVTIFFIHIIKFIYERTETT